MKRTSSDVGRVARVRGGLSRSACSWSAGDARRLPDSGCGPPSRPMKSWRTAAAPCVRRGRRRHDPALDRPHAASWKRSSRSPRGAREQTLVVAGSSSTKRVRRGRRRPDPALDQRRAPGRRRPPARPMTSWPCGAAAPATCSPWGPTRRSCTPPTAGRPGRSRPSPNPGTFSACGAAGRDVFVVGRTA